MSPERVVAILERLEAAGTWFCVDGGWGVDALLGEQTRVHDDLDVAIRREDCDRVRAAFPELEPVEREWWPARFVLSGAGPTKLDFHPLLFDEEGAGRQELPDGSFGLYPADGLGATGTIAGRPVPCISAALQLAHHVYDDPDDVDWLDVTRLCRRFGLELPARYRERPGFVDPRRLEAGSAPIR